MEARRRQQGSADYRQASGVMRSVLVKTVNETYEDELAALARLGVDVTLLWGADDRDVPVRTAERAAAILGEHATVEVVPGVGHLLPLERPEALRTVIERLIG